jgi:hypothetical protein
VLARARLAGPAVDATGTADGCAARPRKDAEHRYNVVMRSRGTALPSLVLLALLAALLYPALVLNLRIAPEASLRGLPPWRIQWGPAPKPSRVAAEAATRLGPRLASIARGGLGGALWNPWLGGGRPGWLASADEGGAPLALVASLVARSGWRWTALVTLEIGFAFVLVYCLLLRLGLERWPAAIGGIAYALSGAVTGSALTWQGSALALGPLALLPAVTPTRSRVHAAAQWTAVLAVLVYCGPAALPFIALAVTLVVFAPIVTGGRRSWVGLALAALLVSALLLPRQWLVQAGGEVGAAPARAVPEAPVTDLRAFLTPPAGAAQNGARGWDPSAPGAFLGAVSVALAVLGLVTAPRRAAAFWLAVVLASVAGVIVPTPALAAVGLSTRPFGSLALATALLAGLGAAALLRRTNGGARALVGSALVLLVAVNLGKNVARSLPFASAQDADLVQALPPVLTAPGTKIAGLLRTLPPDIGATLGLTDVRAQSFSREPKYAALLGSSQDGELPVVRILDARLAGLGASFLLEPLPLRVVSGEIFRRAEQAEAPLVASGPARGLLRYRVDVPPGVSRVGVSSARGEAVHAVLERADRSSALAADGTLATESEAWRWFAVPRSWPAGPAMLVLAGAESRAEATAVIAWDASNLRLAAEEHGLRVWEWDGALPFAQLVALADGASAEGAVRVLSRSAARVELEAVSARPAVLVVQIKYRPTLWRARRNDVPVSTAEAAGVWTGIPVPAGRSRVVLAAVVPARIWLPALTALAVVLAMSVWRRPA